MSTESPYPFDMVDLSFMLFLAPRSPELAALTVAQWVFRHSKTLWEGMLDVCDWSGLDLGTEADPLIGAFVPGMVKAMEAHECPSQPRLTTTRPSIPEAPTIQFASPIRPSDATPLRTSRNKPSEALIDICTTATHVGIIGASGAGKSTFLEVLTVHLAQQGTQVHVIDPHAGPNKWRGAAQVVGNSPEGPNFDEISGILDSAIARTNERLGMIYGGHEEDSFPRIAIICDEWRDIAFNIPDAGDKLARLLSTARKVSITMIIGTQSKNVKSLFGNGQGDSSIRDCLTLFNLFGNKKTGQFYALLDGERYDVPAPVPAGMFPQTPRSERSKPEDSASFLLERPAEPVEADDESPLDDIDPDKRAMILMLHQGGWNRDRIATVAFKGTRRSEALKTIRLVLEHRTP